MPAVYKQRERTTREPRPPHWSLGFITIFIVILIASLLAWAVQVCMAITYEDFLRPLNYIFFGLGFPGIVAGSLLENNGHGITFELHTLGRSICPFVNAAFYILVMLVWLKFTGNSQLKK
jgi:hypothetical protein